MKQNAKVVFILSVMVFSFNCFVKPQDSLKTTYTECYTTKKTSPQILPDSLVDISEQFDYPSRSLKNKFWRSVGYSSTYNATMGLALVLMPYEISKWSRTHNFKISVILNQYKSSFTKPPVFDNDLFVVNYLGHPYQGAFYFNTIRSQGGTFWQSSLFNLTQSFIWEYVWEGGLESPSIQDLIVTPIIGSLVGELSHRATLAMLKNGFKWYEKVAVCIINPAYLINNGFKLKHKNNAKNISKF